MTPLHRKRVVFDKFHCRQKAFAPFTPKRNCFDPLLASGMERGCLHTESDQNSSDPSKRWTDQKRDPEVELLRKRSVLLSCERNFSEVNSLNSGKFSIELNGKFVQSSVNRL